MRTARAAIGSAVFLVLAPGVMAGVVPWLLTGWEARQPLPLWSAFQALGVVLVVTGTAALLHAFARFVREGMGTPAPVAPTERLVVGGLYRYLRNPMYVAVEATIVGQALILGQPVLLAYAALFGIAVWTFVRLYEEPTLLRRFGDDYGVYRRAVPGWWPRRTPWRG